MASKTKGVFVFHPILFALYAVLGTYSQNAAQVPVRWITRPLIVLILLSAMIFFMLWRKTQDAQYGGLVSTLALFWFFFGHLHRAFSERSTFWNTLAGIFIAFLLWTAPLVFLSSPGVWKRIHNRNSVTSFLNTMSIIVVLMPMYITTNTIIQEIRQTEKYKAQSARNRPVVLEKAPTQPDIYVIILDAYGRQDALRDIYGFDNSEFIKLLSQKGFYIADQSSANYPQTQLSLSSMLNLQYLNEYTQGLNDTNDRTMLYEMVQHPWIRELLKAQGYTFIALPSPTLATQIKDADIYFNLATFNINEFEASLLSSTVIGVVADLWQIELPVMGYELHRNYIVFALDKLREIPSIPGPKFVFAHIMLPHPPFIFDHNGNTNFPDRPYIMWDASLFPGTTAEYQKGYTEQVIFLNGKLMEIISDILSRSASPPIIILQGDHGPGAFYDVNEQNNSCLRERFSILNAYYFPDGDYQLLYPSITPVNSFRVVLNQYFGARLDLLENKSYYASWLSPYLYTDVTDQINLPCTAPTENTN